ncbi:MAG: methionine--tRNA ligase [Deltaproteobacteria bacterium]|nr:methionine--tRNA ligase [Deltaproteobacteria bacterium]
MNERIFISTAIPYVNAAPHLGFAAELVLTDALARHHRERGREVFAVTGTDENSLKNARAAEAAGVPVAQLVAQNAALFQALAEPLGLDFDDFIRTSADPRHRPGVEALWRACLARGDLYRRRYRGLYCVGCEAFYTPAELDPEGLCPEHRRPPEVVEEENWFFRLSRFADQLAELITSDRLRIRPEAHRNAALAFLQFGLQDISVSRSVARARGWGIGVPDDPTQVIYVWFDALANYINAAGYAHDEARFEARWHGARRVHVLGKGVLRFHAIYWPAILLSAGLPVPDELLVHAYVTVEGDKIGKSLGNTVDPVHLAHAYGTDVLRYFLLRHVRTTHDSDFTEAALVRARDAELADQLGNLVRRVAGLCRSTGGRVPEPGPSPLAEPTQALLCTVDAAVQAFLPHQALEAIFAHLAALNRYVAEEAPWRLARDPEAQERLHRIVYGLAEATRLTACSLKPFLPVSSARILAQLGLDPGAPPVFGAGRAVGPADPGAVLFPKG